MLQNYNKYLKFPKTGTTKYLLKTRINDYGKRMERNKTLRRD